MQKKQIIQELYDYCNSNNNTILMVDAYYRRHLIFEINNSDYINQYKEKARKATLAEFIETINPEKSNDLYTSHLPTEFKFNFFNHLKNKYKDEDFFKQIGYIHPDWIKSLEHYFQLIEQSYPNALDKLNSLNNWRVTIREIEKLDQLLMQSYNEKQIYDFYKTFLLKFKKTLILNIEIGDFLLKKYNYDENKLRYFFPFFNKVKNNFEQLNYDFIKRPYKHIEVLEINESKLKKDFACFRLFMPMYINYLSLLQEQNLFKKFKQSEANSAKQIYDIMFYSDEPINLPLIIEKSQQYFKFAKDNEVNFDIIKVWHEKQLINENFILDNDNKNTKNETRKYKI